MPRFHLNGHIAMRPECPTPFASGRPVDCRPPNVGWSRPVTTQRIGCYPSDSPKMRITLNTLPTSKGAPHTTV